MIRFTVLKRDLFICVKSRINKEGGGARDLLPCAGSLPVAAWPHGRLAAAGLD